MFKNKEVIMPRGDRTGPRGEGAKTGRQMGYCVGNDQPGFVSQNSSWDRGYGRQFRGGGFGQGRGPGFGFRHGQGNFYRQDLADVSEKTMIENEIRILKDQMSALEERLSKIGKD